MSTADLKEPVISAVRELLRPLGYRKAGAVFRSHVQDVVHLIEIQGSRSSTSERARFTVNVAVFAPELVYPDVREFVKPSVSAAHWRQRLGTLSGAGTVNITLGAGAANTAILGNLSGFTGNLNIGTGAAAGATR